MSKVSKVIDNIKLAGTENGKIEIAIINEPYGSGTPSVASIGVFLSSDATEPDWKVHIPKENIDSVIDALNRAKEEL
jgi:hypothetical protein